VSHEDLARLIRTIPDFPKPGIQFRDVTTLLRDKQGFARTIDAFVERYRDRGVAHVAGVEARGFILAGAIARGLEAGFIPLRKRGKLPGDAVGEDYALEYGTDRIEMHVGAVDAGDRVLLVDDLIATGGTAAAGVRLLRGAGATVIEACFIVDLPELGGAARVQALGVPTFSLVAFAGH
jgi:adenine phosphoribosyltransferase